MAYFHDCGGNSSGGGDPIYQVGAVPIFIDGVTDSTPGLIQTLTTFTVAAGKTRILARIIISSTQLGFWEADDGSGIIATGLVDAGNLESTFDFVPRRELSASTTFTLKFTGASGCPATEVHYHVMTSEI